MSCQRCWGDCHDAPCTCEHDKEMARKDGEQAFDVAVNYFKRHMGWKP